MFDHSVHANYVLGPVTIAPQSYRTLDIPVNDIIYHSCLFLLYQFVVEKRKYAETSEYNQ